MLYDAQKEINGKQLLVTCEVVGDPTEILGCHTYAWQGFGNFFVWGVSYNGVRRGTHSHIRRPGMYVHDLPKEWEELVTHQTIIDLVWTTFVGHMNRGIYFFSDRVNRPMLGSYYFGRTSITPAAFGKWLKARPELGTLVESPLINNPNYLRKDNYSLCQGWMFIPKDRTIFKDQEDVEKKLDKNLYPTTLTYR